MSTAASGSHSAAERELLKWLRHCFWILSILVLSWLFRNVTHWMWSHSRAGKQGQCIRNFVRTISIC